MEMYLFDQMITSLGRLYAIVPVLLLGVYEDSTLSDFVTALLTELSKYALLVLGILCTFTRCLAYFLHFEPATLDALHDAARVFLDPNAASDKDRRQALERHVARLQGHNVVLARMNDAVSARLSLVESRYRTAKTLLVQNVAVTRQIMLEPPSARQRARRASSSGSHLIIATPRIGVGLRTVQSDIQTEQSRACLSPRVFSKPLALPSADGTPELVSTTIQNALKQSASDNESFAQHLLIELLMLRRHVRTLYAENDANSRLATSMCGKQQCEMEKTQTEHETTTGRILVQMLTFRSRLAQSLATCGAAPSPATPATPMTDLQSLLSQLETLRLSEAQTRAEKDSMAKALSEVLANLPMHAQASCCEATADKEPVKELVLALAFTTKMLRVREAVKGGGLVPKALSEDDKRGGECFGTQAKISQPHVATDTRISDSGHPADPCITPLNDRPITHTAKSFANSTSSVSYDQGPSPPTFPPGIPLPAHLARDLSLDCNRVEISSGDIHPPSHNATRPLHPTIMSRGGATTELPNGSDFRHLAHDPILGHIRRPGPAIIRRSDVLSNAWPAQTRATPFAWGDS